MRHFKTLTEQEILALAISLEEEHERIYSDYVEALREHFPSTAELYEGMRKEETAHRQKLIELYRAKFGDHIPLIRRGDVRGFVARPPLWLSQPVQIDKIRRQASLMEMEVRHFYERAALRARDAGIRQLFDNLAQEEREHSQRARDLKGEKLGPDALEKEEDTKRRLFVLQVIQPGLAGLMDGSVSTLAPVFAAAFATRNSWDAFLVGIAASLGAGISMGFAEALSDDGSLTGRGRPLLRGTIEGLMTTLGGVGHTLPFLIHDFRLATAVAVVVVIFELGIISWIRHKYMDTPPLTAALQVGVGGALVFLTGILIGSS